MERAWNLWNVVCMLLLMDEIFDLVQVLAAFLKSIGFIIPLMDAMYANYYTREVMVVLIREFQTPDEEMKKIVLKVSCK